MTTLKETHIEGFPVRRGKVRDVYELGANMLIIIATDRISAFDVVLPNTIPDKGKILTQMSLYWAEELEAFYHNITTDLNQMPEAFRLPELEGRTMMVERAEVIPFECVVRGYLCGSGWQDYQKTGSVCGIRLPKGLQENQQFPCPIFTPATKVGSGHDENISLHYMAERIGWDLALELEQYSIELYTKAATQAWYQGIIIADTKFEFGRLKHLDDDLCLIDEVLTCDSSRFWSLSAYKLGESIQSYDKQYVRDWLHVRWHKGSQPPPLSEDVVQSTRLKYIEGYEKITGKKYD